MSLILNGLFSASVRIIQQSRHAVKLSPAIQTCRRFSDDKEQTVDDNNNTTGATAEATKLSGFAQAFERHLQPAAEAPAEPPKSFASLLRHSKFVDVSSSIVLCMW